MWIAKNKNGVYHLFKDRPVYDEWYEKWAVPPYEKANDVLTSLYMEEQGEVIAENKLPFKLSYTDAPVEVDIETIIKRKHPNKPRKQRTKEQKEIYKNPNCPYDDGTYGKECNNPWSIRCDGDIHNCLHLRMRWLAGASEEEKKKWLEKHKDI